MPPYSCSRAGRGAGVLDGTAGRLTPIDGLGAPAGLVTRGLTEVRGFTAAVLGFTAVVLGLAVLLVRAVAVLVVPAFGRAGDFGLAVALGLRAVSFDFAVPVVRAFALTVAFLTVLARGAAAGLAADIFLAAALSALAAEVMALVAVLIACRALAMVLADDVALVAADVILVAAEVTCAAADETVLADDTGADERLTAVLLPAFTFAGLVLAFFLELLMLRLAALRVTDLVRPELVVLRRAAVRVVVCTGTDLPP
jgi:hypothetical protein